MQTPAGLWGWCGDDMQRSPRRRTGISVFQDNTGRKTIGRDRAGDRPRRLRTGFALLSRRHKRDQGCAACWGWLSITGRCSTALPFRSGRRYTSPRSGLGGNRDRLCSGIACKGKRKKERKGKCRAYAKDQEGKRDQGTKRGCRWIMRRQLTWSRARVSRSPAAVFQQADDSR